jgi:hypothetical protein
MSAAAPEIKITATSAAPAPDHPQCMACSDTDSEKENKMKILFKGLESNDAADAFTKYIMSLCYCEK